MMSALSIKVDSDDVWLRFKTQTGREVALSVTAIIERHADGSLIRAALKDWLCEQMQEPPR